MMFSNVIVPDNGAPANCLSFIQALVDNSAEFVMGSPSKPMDITRSARFLWSGFHYPTDGIHDSMRIPSRYGSTPKEPSSFALDLLKSLKSYSITRVRVAGDGVSCSFSSRHIINYYISRSAYSDSVFFSFKVGLPRDSNPMSVYIIVDMKNQTVELQLSGAGSADGAYRIFPHTAKDVEGVSSAGGVSVGSLLAPVVRAVKSAGGAVPSVSESKVMLGHSLPSYALSAHSVASTRSQSSAPVSFPTQQQTSAPVSAQQPTQQQTTTSKPTPEVPVVGVPGQSDIAKRSKVSSVMVERRGIPVAGVPSPDKGSSAPQSHSVSLSKQSRLKLATLVELESLVFGQVSQSMSAVPADRTDGSHSGIGWVVTEFSGLAQYGAFDCSVHYPVKSKAFDKVEFRRSSSAGASFVGYVDGKPVLAVPVIEAVDSLQGVLNLESKRVSVEEIGLVVSSAMLRARLSYGRGAGKHPVFEGLVLHHSKGYCSYEEYDKSVEFSGADGSLLVSDKDNVLEMTWEELERRLTVSDNGAVSNTARKELVDFDIRIAGAYRKWWNVHFKLLSTVSDLRLLLVPPAQYDSFKDVDSIVKLGHILYERNDSSVFDTVSEFVEFKKMWEVFLTYNEQSKALSASQMEMNKGYSGWRRYFVVPSGLIHASTSCSTCNKGFVPTRFIWLVNFAGLNPWEVVKVYGNVLCSVCFPEMTEGSSNG